MASQNQVEKSRRSPKPGTGHTFLRYAGIGLQIIGGVTILLSCVGLVGLLIRIMPGMLASIQNLESQMAGFVFIIQFVWLLVPLVFIVLGMASFGLGIVLVRAGTEPAEKNAAGDNLKDSRQQHTDDGDDQTQM